MWKTNKFTYADASKVDCRKIEEDLTITIQNPLNKFGKKFLPEIIKLFSYIITKTAKYIIVPRFYVESELLFKYESANFEFTKPITFISQTQIDLFQQLKDIYSKPAGRVLIMPTGQGKTFVSCALIQHLNLKCLIVVHNLEIAENWRKICAEYMGQYVGIYGGKNKTKCAITIGVIHSLIKCNKDWFDFDFIIYDEVTEFLSEKRRIIFELAAKPFLLGLTATPQTPKARIFDLYLGPRLVVNVEQKNNWEIETHAIKYYGPPEFTERILSSIGFTSAVEMDKQFMKDNFRNELIISKIKWLRSIGKKVFVFVSICEFGDILRELCLPHFDEKEIIVFMGSRPDRETLNKNIIITTYRFCSKGVSIDCMDSIILCQPRMADTEQTIGRILRAGGDTKEKRYIIDIVDMNTTLKSQYSVRKKIYNKLGPIIDFKIEVDY